MTYLFLRSNREFLPLSLSRQCYRSQTVFLKQQIESTSRALKLNQDELIRQNSWNSSSSSPLAPSIGGGKSGKGNNLKRLDSTGSTLKRQDSNGSFVFK